MKLIVCVLALLSVLEKGLALKCWTCNRALTNEECQIKGSIATCKPNQACVNQETTSVDGSRYQITKRCQHKQFEACRLNDRRNPGNFRTFCKQFPKNTICSCCCDTDLCNGPQVECKNVVTCRQPNKPGNGRIQCQHPITYGSTCNIVCNRGFRRVGPRTVTCTNGTSQGYWSPRQSIACVTESRQPTQRQPRRCPKMIAPVNGGMVCENQGRFKSENSYNYMGTICAFKCDLGYFRSGSDTAQCLDGGRWSVMVPKCQKGTCNSPPQDANRIDSCSDGNYFGTICDMSCRAGHRLVGPSSVSCQVLNELVRQGQWSTEFPRCVKAECRPRLTRPVNGAMSCTRGNTLGSVCTFSCKKGFQLTGLEMTVNGAVECVQTGDSVFWNGETPRCVRLQCARPDMPENGNVVCGGDGRLGTKCVFSCNPGFDLVGTPNATVLGECVRAVGAGEVTAKMTVESIACAEVRCPAERTAPTNGQVYCSRVNLQDSICIFSCDEGYDMDGTTDRMVTNICNYAADGDGVGRWSADPPTCDTRFFCDVTHGDPENGAVDCSDGSFSGSICTFTCDDGFELYGASVITCRDSKFDGDAKVEWTDEAPVCVASTCPELWYDQTSMMVSCNREKQANGYPVGTECTYQCSDSIYFIDATDGSTKAITCTSKNTWNTPSAPRCILKKCPRLPKLENGNEPMCSRSNFVSSTCVFKCNSKYSLSHNEAITCDSGGRGAKVGRWDIQPPKCILNECTKLPPTPRRGVMSCSNGAKLGSMCTLQCDSGYAPRIPEIDCRMTKRMVDSKMVEMPWFVDRENFCCSECLSELYITLAVNARYERGLQDVVDFVKIFLPQLSQRNNRIVFSAFLYNAVVDQATVIDRFELKESDNLPVLLSMLADWSVQNEGKESNAMGALRYANSNFFATLNPGAVNYLIIAGDESPKYDTSAQLESMDERGINIIAGVTNDFARITWGKVLGDDGTATNLNANEIISIMDNAAIESGCSTLSPECA